MIKLVHIKPLESIDPTLRELMSLSIDWLQLVSHLTTAYGNRARQFHFDRMIHVLIINPSDYDMAIYISVEERGTRIEMNLLRRDPDLTITRKQRLDEAAQVSHLVNVVCHWLWRTMVLKDRRSRQ